MNFHNLKKKLKLLHFIFSHKSVNSISDEDYTKGVILSEIGAGFKIDNVEQHFVINNITDRIASRLFNKNSFEEDFKITMDGSFHQNMWFYSAVAGYASIWELHVKLLAEKLGVEIKKPYEIRSKKHKKTKIMTYKDLNEIILEVNTKISSSLELRLKTLNELRSALVHCNFDQLRILANNCSHKYKKEHQGNVYVFSLGDPKGGSNLSDNLCKNKREEQSLFSWFLEITNSHLLREVWKLLEESIFQINFLIGFEAFSFDERKTFFKRVVLDGEKLTPSMMEQYADVLKHSSSLQTVESYFSRMKELFGPDVFSDDLARET